MDDIVKIKCPVCGSIFSVPNLPDLDKKTVTCPVCKKKSKIAECERIMEQKDSEATQYAYGKKKSSEDTTTLDYDKVLPIGRLVNMQTGESHQLSLGKNTIGRKVSVPLPSVTIPIEERQTHNTMSREHAVIEVTRLANGSHRHFLYHWKGKNGTYVDEKKVENADRIILNDGEVIRMGQVKVRFEIY